MAVKEVIATFSDCLALRKNDLAYETSPPSVFPNSVLYFPVLRSAYI